VKEDLVLDFDTPCSDNILRSPLKNSGCVRLSLSNPDFGVEIIFEMASTNYRLLIPRHHSFIWIIFLLSLVSFQSVSQISDPIQKIISTLTVGPIPEDLLATKTIALYDPSFTSKDLNQIQTGFNQTGIDAVIYYPIDLPMCNRDVQKTLSDYLIKREIKYLCFLQKKEDVFEFTFTLFNKTKTLMDPGQACWKMTGNTIREVSLDVYRTALNSQKRINMLVSPIPEYDLTLRFIRGTRGEYYAIDLKIDKLGIIKTGQPDIDTALEEIFKNHYPFAYQFFEPNTEETDIRGKGFLFVLSFIHTRGLAAMDLLGYNISKVGSAIASVSYPNGEIQLKTLDAPTVIYKFFFKQLQNGNIYLGTRWDADPDWQQALLNQIKGLKKELRIN